jgi:hypothetical protein
MKKDDVEVVVVSIDDYSLDVLKKKKFYAFPRGSRQIGKYFAFYKNRKIEFYGEVSESFEGDKNEVGIGYWLNCLPDAEPPFQIVKFKEFIKLEKPIVKDDNSRGRGHVQGRVYTTLKKLLNAKIISDLR